MLLQMITPTVDLTFGDNLIPCTVNNFTSGTKTSFPAMPMCYQKNIAGKYLDSCKQQ
jgi:hypothetical protein